MVQILIGSTGRIAISIRPNTNKTEAIRLAKEVSPMAEKVMTVLCHNAGSIRVLPFVKPSRILTEEEIYDILGKMLNIQ